jgi:hypothetical protein
MKDGSVKVFQGRILERRLLEIKSIFQNRVWVFSATDGMVGDFRTGAVETDNDVVEYDCKNWRVILVTEDLRLNAIAMKK